MNKKGQKIILPLIALASITLSQKSNSTFLEPKTLALTQIIRIGTSTPKSKIYEFSTLEKYGPESLTINGERMMYRLGQEIQEKFKDFFGEDRVLKFAKFYSESTPPSIQSSQCFMIGLQNFSKNEAKVIENEKITLPPLKNLNYLYKGNSPLPHNIQFYPIHVDNKDNNSSLRNSFFITQQKEECPLLFKELESKGDLINQETHNKFFSLLELLREAGVVPKGLDKEKGWNFENLRLLFSAAETKLYNDGVYDDDLDPEMFDMLRAWYTFSYELQFFDENSDKGKYIINEIVNSTIKNFEIFSTLKSKEEKSGMKYRVFMGSGENIYILNKLMGLSKKKCIEDVIKKGFISSKNCYLYPKFGSSLTFELSEFKGKKYVRVLLDLEMVDLPCESSEVENGYCSFEDFKKLAEDNFTYNEFYTRKCFENPENEIIDPINEIKILSNKAKKEKYLAGAIWLMALILGIIYIIVVMNPRNQRLSEWEKALPISSNVEDGTKKYTGLAERSMSTFNELSLKKASSGMLSPTNQKKKNLPFKSSLEEIQEVKDSQRENKEFKMNIKNLSEEDLDFSAIDSQITENDREIELSQRKSKNNEEFPNPYEMSPERRKVTESGSSSNEHLSPDNFRNKLRFKYDLDNIEEERNKKVSRRNSRKLSRKGSEPVSD